MYSAPLCIITQGMIYPKLKQGMNPYRNIEYFEKRKEFIRRKRKIAKNRVAAANPTYV